MYPHWIPEVVFYHIYPLGLCAAPARNDFSLAPVQRLHILADWLDHIQKLGANAIYLGPLFESTAHGYDTVDYFRVDRRLGTNESLKGLLANIKQRGIRVVFDGVFNHVGRDFWAFRDLLQHGQHSPYRDWFANLDFDRSSPNGDPFSYEGWAGHYDLVKLNLHNPAVRQHLFDAVRFWIDEFDIDGLRLDAADHIHPDFFTLLRGHCHQLKPDFWLMGEVVHGDYRRWANAAMLDATTNYECYKGLYSSHLEHNYFEIAYSLNRLFGAQGIYRDLLLYNFADNHDVNRVASSLKDPAHLYTLYGLLFTMPGVPSIYYGSEWGIAGTRTPNEDRMLRPTLNLHQDDFPQPHLLSAIQRLIAIRQQLPALKRGGYRQLFVAHEQFAFERHTDGQTLIIALNAAPQAATLHLENIEGNGLVDLLNVGEVFPLQHGRLELNLHPHWLRILQVA